MSRRAVVAAAWTAPIVALVASAPAYAASNEPVLTFTMQFVGTNGTQRQYLYRLTNAQPNTLYSYRTYANGLEVSRSAFETSAEGSNTAIFNRPQVLERATLFEGFNGAVVVNILVTDATGPSPAP